MVMAAVCSSDSSQGWIPSRLGPCSVRAWLRALCVITPLSLSLKALPQLPQVMEDSQSTQEGYTQNWGTADPRAVLTLC